MDLVTIGIGIASAVLGGSIFDRTNGPGPFRWRRILTWTDGWVATELVSVAALRTAVGSLDLPSSEAWEVALSTGLRTFVLVVREGGPPEWAVLCTFDRVGSVWEIREVFGHGMNRTLRPDQDQHVAELCDHMRVDLGAEIARRARSIEDLDRRYAFLRAVVRQPSLAARVVPEAVFADVVMETASVVAPERVQAIVDRQASSLASFEPISDDLVVRRLPYGIGSGDVQRALPVHD